MNTDDLDLFGVELATSTSSTAILARVCDALLPGSVAIRSTSAISISPTALDKPAIGL